MIVVRLNGTHGCQLLFSLFPEFSGESGREQYKVDLSSGLDLT